MDILSHVANQSWGKAPENIQLYLQSVPLKKKGGGEAFLSYVS